MMYETGQATHGRRQERGESLSGPPEVLAATINGASKEQIYDAAEGVGADRQLLARIGS